MPHAAMLYAHDEMFQSSCDASKFSNMFEFLLPILEYLNYLLPDFQTVCSILIGIRSDENRRRIFKKTFHWE